MPKKTQAKSTAPYSTIAGLSLLDIDLAYDPSFEETEGIDLNYHVQITPPKQMEDDFYFFKAQMMIGKSEKGSDDAKTAVRANYFCALVCRNMKDEAIVTAARKYAQTTIWSNFTSLAAVVTQQMRAEFPILPPFAGRVTVKADDNEALEEGETSSI